MKKRNILLFVWGLVMSLPVNAQSWNKWDTRSTISDVLGIASATIESSERKKQMEIEARQKVEFEQSFQDALTEAKAYEAQENWEEALEKYEEASKLNCKYGYTDQRTLTRKINGLYVKSGREEDGPSILNNAKTILSDYSQYRYVRDNPVYVNKKYTNTKIVRVACSDKETRLEMEHEYLQNNRVNVWGTAYIKGNKGGKLGLVGVENIAMAPTSTTIPWPYQKLRFVLIFPPLPEEANEFDFIVPSSNWQFKKMKCK